MVFVFQGTGISFPFGPQRPEDHNFLHVQYRSKVSYHPLARRESRLERRDSRLSIRDSRLERRDSRLSRRESRLARA